MKNKFLLLTVGLTLFIAFSSCERCIECKYQDSNGVQRVAHHCGKGNDSYKQKFEHDFCDTAQHATSCGCYDVKP